MLHQPCKDDVENSFLHHHQPDTAFFTSSVENMIRIFPTSWDDVKKLIRNVSTSWDDVESIIRIFYIIG